MSSNDLTAVLRSILDRLDRLEQTPAPAGEELQPSYVQVDSQGHTIAILSGQVNALGLTLPWGAGPPGQSQIRWVDSTAATRVILQGGTIPGPGGHSTDSYDSILQDNAGNELAALQLQNTPFSGIARLLATAGIGGAQQATVLDSSGASSFLRLLASQQLQMDHGVMSLTWTANVFSATNIVPHGLGRTPSGVWLQPGNLGYMAIANAVSPTQITFQGSTTAGNSVTNTVNFYWLAIG